jgi:arylformamidase
MPSYHLIDVSQWMDDFHFHGDQRFIASGPFNRVSGNNPEFVYDLQMCSQSGTHIQGAHYFLENGARIEEFPLACFEGPAVMIDLEKRGVDTTREDLILKLGHESISNQILVLRTGHMEEVIESGVLDQAKRPGLSLDAAHWLAEDRGVKMIAIDSMGVESRATRNYEVNKYLCENKILLLEGLVNLHRVKSRRFFLEAFPLKIRGVEGAPCRAVIKEPIGDAHP